MFLLLGLHLRQHRDCTLAGVEAVSRAAVISLGVTASFLPRISAKPGTLALQTLGHGASAGKIYPPVRRNPDTHQSSASQEHFRSTRLLLPQDRWVENIPSELYCLPEKEARMDAGGLRSRIQGTLSPDADIRRQVCGEIYT